jgi:hypothetical protein
MPSSNYPNGFANGVTIRGVPIDIPHPGEVFWVNNSGVLAKGGVAGSNSNDGSYRRPFSTIDYAIGKCTANRGDVIYAMPGHSEAVSAADGIDFDVAGVTLIGLGQGSDRAQLRITAAGANIAIGAANVSWVNMRITAAVADVVEAINIEATGDDFSSIGCIYDEEEADENYIVVFAVADGANGGQFINNEYWGDDVANDNFWDGAGTHTRTSFIGNSFNHSAVQTGVEAFIKSATAFTNGKIIGNTFVNQEPVAAASCVVLTGTGNSGICDNNYISFLDTDATNANCVSAFDVTGMGMGRIQASGAVDETANIFSRSTLTS